MVRARATRQWSRFLLDERASTCPPKCHSTRSSLQFSLDQPLTVFLSFSLQSGCSDDRLIPQLASSYCRILHRRPNACALAIASAQSGLFPFPTCLHAAWPFEVYCRTNPKKPKTPLFHVQVFALSTTSLVSTLRITPHPLFASGMSCCAQAPILASMWSSSKGSPTARRLV